MGALFPEKSSASAAPGAFWESEKPAQTWKSWEREARLFLSVVRAIASIRMGAPEACARPARRRSLHDPPPRASVMRPKRP